VSRNGRLVVCDICETLYRSNTTTDYVRYVLEHMGLSDRLLLYRATVDRWSPIFLVLAICCRMSAVDVGRRILLALLRGIHRDQLAELSTEFVSSFLTHRKISESHEYLDRAKRRGDAVLLASASIDPVVEAIAAKLGVRAVSSRLGYDRHGRCRGTLELDLTGRKVAAIRAMLLPGMALTVLTDNRCDRPLLELADEPIVFLRRESDRRHWRGFKARFVQIGAS